MSLLKKYWSNAFRWRRGRQETGYDNMLLLTGLWPLPFDCYLLRFPIGSMIPPHVDKVETGRHFRLNLILKSPPSGGDFICRDPIYASRRIKLFRPDCSEHAVTEVKGGSRYVLSVGWILR